MDDLPVEQPLRRLRETVLQLAEAPVICREWAADNGMLGPPELRQATRLAQMAGNAFEVAEHLLAEAIAAVPDAGQEG